MKIHPKFQPTVQTYNQHASQFAVHLERRSSEEEREIFTSMVKPGSFVLDAGCGTCRDSAPMVAAGYKVLGIDASEELLKEAAKLHPEVPTQLMSLNELTFDDETFDGIWCRATILHLDRKEVPRVLSAFHRILKPGGVLYVQTKKGRGEGTQAAPFDPAIVRHFTFFEDSELKTMVEAAGFEITKSYIYNSSQRPNPGQDQDWVVIFARKK